MAERARSSRSAKAKPRAKGKANGKAGHNSGNVVAFPAGNVPAEVLQGWLEKIEAGHKVVDKLKTPYDSARSKLQKLYQGAKADGCSTEAIRDARRLVKLDRTEVAHIYTETGRCLLLMESPLATQLELFKTPDWPEPVSANLQGYRVGKSGGNPDEAPFVPGSENHAQWMHGYESGQAELDVELRNTSA